MADRTGDMHTRELLSLALARWALDDDKETDFEIRQRAEMFEEDVERILTFVPASHEYIVESRPEFDTEGGQGFAVNGVGFAVEYEQEGNGVVQPAATWRPPCEDCDEPVKDFGDALCPTCEAV